MRAAIPFQNLKLSPEIESEVLRSVERVIDSHHYVLWREVESFEKEFAAYLGVRHAVAVASGTDALVLALLASGVMRPGAEVIVPALTSPFTAIAVARAGGRPVFADVGPSTWTLDAACAARRLTDKTVAIVPVHLYGNPVDWPPLARLAGAHRLFLLEDACQAHGASVAGVKVGGLGAAAAFSFYPTKNLGAAGDGGAVVTNDDGLAARCLHLRNGAQIRRYVHDQPCFHSRLDEVQAAVLRAKLPYLERWNEERNRAYRRYRDGVSCATFPDLPAEVAPAAHLAVLCHRERDRLRAHLGERGIETLIHYPVPLHRMPAFAAGGSEPCPHAERICAQLLSLPLYASIPEAAQQEVLGAIAEFRADA